MELYTVLWHYVGQKISLAVLERCQSDSMPTFWSVQALMSPRTLALMSPRTLALMSPRTLALTSWQGNIA